MNQTAMKEIQAYYDIDEMRAGMLNDFTICVNRKEHKCNKIIAMMFSPVIRKYVLSDPTTSIFVLDTEDEDCNFDKVVDYMYLKPVDRNDHEIEVIEMLNQLGCHNLIDDILSNRNYNTDNFETCASALFYRKSMNQDYSEEIEHLATNFYRIDSSVFELLDLETIDEIISSPSLVCDDEHSLFEFVVKLVQDRGSEYQTLFTNIVFPNLPPDDIETFLAIFDITFMNSFILRSLARSRSINIPENRYRKSIFHYLRETAGGNPATAGLVSVTVSSINGGLYEGYSSDDPNVVLDYDNNRGWYSKNENGQWMMIDLKENKAKVRKYVIKFGKDTEKTYTQNWIFEASNDKTTWTKLHQNSSKHSPLSKYAYKVGCDDYYRYFRIRQIDKFWGARCYQCITSLELYGIIISK